MRPRLAATLFALSVAVLGCSAAGGSPGLSAAPSTGSMPIPEASLPAATTLVPVQLPHLGCLDPHPDLATILEVDLDQRPGCFGRSALTFEAIVVAAVVDCVPVRVQPIWLWCPPTAYLAAPGTAVAHPTSVEVSWASLSLSTDGLPVAASAAVPLLEIYAAPGSGLERVHFDAGTIVQVTGHFDDPAAATCRLIAGQAGMQLPTPAEVVLGCRHAFVVTALRPKSA